MPTFTPVTLLTIPTTGYYPVMNSNVDACNDNFDTLATLLASLTLPSTVSEVLSAALATEIPVLLRFPGAIGSGSQNLEKAGFCVPFNAQVIRGYARFNTAPGAGTVVRLKLREGTTDLLDYVDFSDSEGQTVKSLAGLTPTPAELQAGDWIRPRVEAQTGDPAAAADLSMTVVLRRTTT